MPNPRQIAFQILLKVEQDGAYSNLALNHSIRENRLSAVDSSFVSALVYGVLERAVTLDYIIKQYSKIPLRKIETKTKIILRMGIYQLLFMDKVPDSAAVNESVNLAKKQRMQQSAGFINGILRSITRAETPYRLPEKEKDAIYHYSIKYAVPQSLVRLWIGAYGFPQRQSTAFCARQHAQNRQGGAESRLGSAGRSLRGCACSAKRLVPDAHRSGGTIIRL